MIGELYTWFGGYIFVFGGYIFKFGGYISQYTPQMGAIREFQKTSSTRGKLAKQKKSGIEPRRVVYIYI